MKFIDLFCGIGGFHQALNRLNHKCVFACDIDKKCRDIYELNYGIKPVSDICDVNPKEIEDFDILTAGFPCQSFSNAGNKKAFDDKRGNLFLEIIKIADEKKPKFMFLENVKHIKKIDNGKTYEVILKTLEEHNYNVQVVELSPHQLGIPQQRERVIFICIRSDIYNNNEIKLPIDSTKQCNFETFFESNANEKYKISKDIENVLEAWEQMIKVFETGQKMSPMILAQELNKEYSDEEFDKLPNWKQNCIIKNKDIYEKYQTHWDKWLDENDESLNKRQIYSQLDWQAGPLKENESIFNHFIQIRQSGIRVKKTKYFPTLVAIVQTPIYGKERRYLTPRECARLQSFPDDFTLHETDNIAYKQFGNAVNVDVVYTVMKATLSNY